MVYIPLYWQSGFDYELASWIFLIPCAAGRFPPEVQVALAPVMGPKATNRGYCRSRTGEEILSGATESHSKTETV